MAFSPVLLASDSVGSTSSFIANIPPGKYEAFVLHLDATSDTGQTMVASDLGRVRLAEAGRDIVNIDGDFLANINALEGGNIFQNFPVAASDTRMNVVIPRGFGDDNVHAIVESDLAQVVVQYGASFNTKLASGTIELYGLVRTTGQMAYNLRITQIDQDFSGGGTFPFPVRDENSVAAYMDLADTDISRIRVTQDGDEVANISRKALLDLSNAFERTDFLSDGATAGDLQGHANANATVAALKFAEPGQVGEFLSDDIVIELTATGAVQPFTVGVFSADFTPPKLRQTRAEAAAIVQRKMTRKNTLGRGRPNQVLRLLSQ